MKYLLLWPLMAIFFATSISCKKGDPSAEIGFARGAFALLTEGQKAAEDNINWEVFTSLGIDVGSQYTLLTTDQDRSKFRENFVDEFSKSFKNNGGTTKDFTDWKIENKTDGTATVSARSTAGHLFLETVTEDDGYRLVSMKIIK